MNWYNSFINISVIGGICSFIIVLVAYLLIVFVLKSNKYRDKTVDSTPLERYVIILSIGGILTFVFSFIIILVRFLNRM